jgi:prepilin-type processing-associated H-X9-DG protein
MDIVKLPRGEDAPKDSDCIRIEQTADGRHRLEGSALMNCGDSNEAESVSMVDGGTYPTFEAAEAAGMAWADGHCVTRLYVSTTL